MVKKQFQRTETLLNCVGIELDSFFEFLEWALSQQLVYEVSQLFHDEDFFKQKDALKQFRDQLSKRTGRNWSNEDLNKLFEAVRKSREQNFREPVSYGDYLKLLWNSPHCCSKCGKKPPEIRLHIDHIIPVSLGGKSIRSNIQFLCETCNLRKSNKLEGGSTWLDLM